LGLLGGEAAAPQPRAERPGVVPDGELLVDQLRQPRSGPQFGGEPVFDGAAPQPPQDDLLLGDCKLGWPARYRASFQALRAAAAEGGEPAPDRPDRDPEEPGDLVSRVPFEESLDGELPPVLQFDGGALGSHPQSVTLR